MRLANRLNTVEEYYFSRKLRQLRQMVADGKPVINLGIGSPDLPPPPGVIPALADALSHPTAHQYQSYQGLPELRQAFAYHYRQLFRVEVNPESEVLPLMGSKEGIMHISLAFLNPGDQVLIPNPGYPTYESVTRLVGAEPVFYDLASDNGWQPDLETLSATDLSRVRLMWVNYPHMPTGAKGSQPLFENLVNFAKKNDLLLVNDNPYSAVLNDTPLSVFSAPGAWDVALELNSLSKTFNLSGWRVGWLTGKKEFADAVLTVKSNMDSGMFYGIQQGAVAALRSDPEWLAGLNGIYRKRRELIFELSDVLNCRYDRAAAGMFVWAKLPETVENAEGFVDEVLDTYHVFITPGSVFGSNGARYIRFSLCLPEEKIRDAIKRLR